MSCKRVAVLISGRGSNMAALIEAAKDKNYPAEIVLIISNRPDAGGLLVARAAAIATEVVDHTEFGKDRAGFERAVQAILEKERIDLVCLAGFMRLLTADFVKKWQFRILNIHPALLPAFKGLDTHKRALEAGTKLHGATVHFVVPEMDSGPIIAQGAVSVDKGDSEEILAMRVLKIEHRIYPLALRLVAEGRVRVVDGRCLIDGVPVLDFGKSHTRSHPKVFRAAVHRPLNTFARSGVIVFRQCTGDAATVSGAIIKRGDAMNGRGETKLIFPGLADFYASVGPISRALVRVVIGVMFLMHVSGKFKVGAAAVAANVMSKNGLEPSLFFAYAAIILEKRSAASASLSVCSRASSPLHSLLKWPSPCCLFTCQRVTPPAAVDTNMFC